MADMSVVFLLSNGSDIMKVIKRSIHCVGVLLAEANVALDKNNIERCQQMLRDANTMLQNVITSQSFMELGNAKEEKGPCRQEENSQESPG